MGEAAMVDDGNENTQLVERGQAGIAHGDLSVIDFIDE
jgi:hypothetical protein